MGWSNGPRLAGEVWDIVRGNIQEVDRWVTARGILQVFCKYDADDWYNETQLLEDAGMPVDGEDSEIDQFWNELR